MNRRSICFVLSLLFALFSFSGCRNSVCHTTTLKADEIIAETDNHIVYRVGDLYYIEFFNELTGEFNDISSRDASIPFNSMSELREFILENKFDATQQKDFEDSSENGAIEIINVEHLWVPVYPDDVKLVESYWFTRRYAFVFESSCARYINHDFMQTAKYQQPTKKNLAPKRNRQTERWKHYCRLLSPDSILGATMWANRTKKKMFMSTSTILWTTAKQL